MLAGIAGLEIVLAARTRTALDALAAQLRPAYPEARIETALLDRARPEDLARLRPWAVVDAAGPFQGSGTDLARAACALGAHSIDLADGRAYVAGFPAALDAAARAAGVLAVTGASSTPALSHAALEPLVAGWRRLDTVAVAISPGAQAPRGLSVIRAILSYTGRPVRVFAGGGWTERSGWSGSQRRPMPGLGRRWLALCETPDLDLLPARFPIREEALFLAGLELGAMHLGLAALAMPVRAGLVPTLVPLAKPLRFAADILAPLGTDRGGMTVEARGLDAEGRRAAARWFLTARDGAGPNVPAAAAAALVRALAEGRETRSGAFACAGLIGRDAILRELAGLPIRTRTEERRPDEAALFPRILGSRFDALPAPVRAVHGAAAGVRLSGQAVARTGRHPLARLAASLMGLPPSGCHETRVAIEAAGTGERWTRRFGTARFASTLCDAGDFGRFEERIGPLRFRFRAEAEAAALVWHWEGWSLLGLPLPARLAPRIRARSWADGPRYRFRVAVAHPWTGLVFAYRGRLAPG
ncbi:MAG: saccharopine dehydrogenase [Methylobacterium sp. CG08_land_8_20_14_0_20_71_15]|nr:MAG: saccharopine dehydrogenase [Methylobacterium sp. CG09_land_8_20_14_0_10_71_15]PIU14003.1 MAG: saccharopine dehydrogenase [Methylobacterium sp. CG08_land_8_20_14_0_20_71_15]